MRIGSITLAERQAAQHGAPVFMYLFTWETPVLGGKLKSPHALEIPFVFDNVATDSLSGDTPTNFALAEKMSKAWLAFARSGDPNHGGIPKWPGYSIERSCHDDLRQRMHDRERSVRRGASRVE